MLSEGQMKITVDTWWIKPGFSIDITTYYIKYMAWIHELFSMVAILNAEFNRSFLVPFAYTYRFVRP